MIYTINIKARLEDRDGYYLRYQGDSNYLFAGWKIHIAAVPKNAQIILDIVSNYLVNQKIPFKFIKTEEELTKSLGKSWSRANSGKFITIYPHSELEFKTIVETLYKKLKLFESPYILSDENYKEGPIFYRYGRIHDKGLLVYNEDKSLSKQALPFYDKPSWVSDPFTINNIVTSDADDELFHGRYNINKVLYMSNAGGTYLAKDSETESTVVLKESRPNMLMLDGQFDAVYYRKIEKDILNELHQLEFQNVPIILDEFWEWKHYYIVVSYVNGSKLIDESLGSVNVWQEMTRFINKYHNKHITLGDISPQNLIINNAGITTIDFELASSDKNINLGLPFMRTPGFRITDINLFDETRYLADRQGIALVYMYMLFPTYDLFDQKYSQPGVLLSYIKKYNLDTKNYQNMKSYLSVIEKSLVDTWEDVVRFYADISLPQDDSKIQKHSNNFSGPVDKINMFLREDIVLGKSISAIKDSVSVFALETGEIYDPSYDKDETTYVVKKLINKLEN